MDDPALFTAFLTNVAGITNARSRNEMQSFTATFRMLLSSSENEIDSFVKNTHAANSARANNQRILIPTDPLTLTLTITLTLTLTWLSWQNVVPSQSI